jgi:CRP/FNR family cyclic AMP-dependent transcriptional regulator
VDDSLDVEKALATAPLLADLDEKIIKRLAEQGVRRVYPPGTWIIQQDDPASALYVILRGRARAEKDGELDRTPSELYPGDFFGELALIEDHPRTASVLAVEETECILFVSWEFTALLKEHPQMAVPIMNALIKRLHRREHKPDPSSAPH